MNASPLRSASSRSFNSAADDACGASGDSGMGSRTPRHLPFHAHLHCDGKRINAQSNSPEKSR